MIILYYALPNGADFRVREYNLVMAAASNIVYTIGHSTRSIEDFVKLLQDNHIQILVDVRTIPKSRHNPQFEGTVLATALKQQDIGYIHMKDLGGLRPKAKESINLAWHNQSFRNYADYMQTSQFGQALQELISFSSSRTAAIMCAEAVPWRCHRSLIADALIVRGIEVREIISEAEPRLHKMTSFAVVGGTNVSYPLTGVTK